MIAFCHIPKTAGTTFNHVLRRRFGHRVLAAQPRSGDLYTHHDLKLDLRLYPDVQVLSGHGVRPYVDFGQLGPGMRWITFLRDPKQTLVSLYVHQFTSPHPSHRKFKLPFKKWLDAFPRDNRQTKWIAGAADFERARAILKSFSVIGLADRFDDSMILMRHRLGLSDLDLRYQKKMVSRDQNLSARTHDLIQEAGPKLEALTETDEALYRWACEEAFPHQVEEFGGEQELAAAREELQHTNRRYRDSKIRPRIWAYRFKNNICYKPYRWVTKNFG